MYFSPRHPPAIAKRIAQRLAAKEHPGMVPENYDLASDAGVRLELLKMAMPKFFQQPLNARQRAENSRRRQAHIARSIVELNAFIATCKLRSKPKD